MSAPKDIDRADVLGELQHRWYGDGDATDMIRWTLDELVELDILKFREPADDPSKDLVGTVRRDELTGRTAHKLDSDSRPWAEYTAGFTSYDWIADEDVAGWPVIGAVPGTPAAKQAPSAEQVAQWETDDLELAVDPHEPVVVVRAETAPPRVFSSDGPEPPADVTLLERINFGETRRFPYAKRGSHGWVNCETPDADTSQVYGFQWPPGYDTSFREVIS